MAHDVDPARDAVFDAVFKADPGGTRFAATIRSTIDQLYDGQHTGRYKWDQLYKTEKTHCGTLVEINLQREFDFDDGGKLDYRIVDIEVDCKYSQRSGGWMIPNEAHGELLLVVTADDAKGSWSAGIVRARPEWLGVGRNRDAKATLSPLGRENIRWLAHDAALPPNVLLDLPPAALDEIFAPVSGQARVNALFRHAQGQRIGRGVIATVAQQADYMKRVRGNGGARTALRDEGIVILGSYAAHKRIGIQLGLEQLESGESMSVRLATSGAGEPWSAEIDGTWWRVASPADAVEVAPMLPRVTGAG